MNGLRGTDERTDDRQKALTVRKQRIFYGAIAILGIVALVVVVRIWMAQPSTAAGQPQSQPTQSVQEVPAAFSTPLPSVAYSAEAEALFVSLNCLCGTCSDTLAECNCGQARSMKGYVDSLVESDISESEVVDKVVEKYGPQALVSGQ
jgi:cytochrome c-type biogenesis protein CcmH/NrfF